jgi:HK97 family phage portal protein
MGLWSRLFKSGTSKPDSWLVDWVRGGEKTAAGVSVSPDSAMRIAAVWACIRVRSEDIGKVPLHMYKRLPKGKERATEHPYQSLVRDAPNTMQTALEFRQLMQTWLDLHGNAYAYKEADSSGVVTALWPICPEYVQVLRVAGTNELFYKVRYPDPARPEVTYPAEYVIHIRGLSLDGIVGVSPITYHRETAGLALAAQKYGAGFFGDSAQPTGIIKVPTLLSKEAAGALRQSWESTHQGTRKTAVLDAGMEWVQTSVNNTDAQYLETRQFQIREICRIYRMPPHKIADLSDATFSNIEQQSLEYVGDCLSTEAARWEQALWRQLLNEKEQKVYFFEFLLDALTRGDLASRYNAYATGRNWGWLSANDIRAIENMNPVPEGDMYLQPGNMMEAGTSYEDQLKLQMANKPQPPAKPPAGEKEARQIEALTTGIARIRSAETQPLIHIEAAKQPDVYIEAPVTVNTPENKTEISVAAPDVRVEPPVVNIAPAIVEVDVAAPNVEVAAPNVQVDVAAPPSKKRKTRTKVNKHDERGRILEFEQEEI